MFFESFQALPAQRRQLILAGAVLAVLMAVLIAGYLVFLRSPYETLAAGLRPADAATIVAELDKRKTPYRLAEGGTTILVPAKNVDATRLAIAGQELPLKGTVGFELFNKSDMGLTEFAQQVNYRRALQGELTRTILELEGIESARVHLMLAEPGVFKEDRRPSKASVALTPKLGATLTPQTIRGVQQLVAAAAPDLDPAAVVVLDGRGAVVSEAPATMEPNAARLSVEAYHGAAVELALRKVFGARAFLVRVTALDSARAQAWSPPEGEAEAAVRDFPIRVLIRTDAALSEAERRNVQVLAISAATLQPSLGDSLVIEDRAVSPPPAASAPEAAAPPARAGALPAPLVQGLAAGALALLLLLAWRLHVRRTNPPVMTEADKQRMAHRLQHLLVQEDVVVTRD